MTEYPRGSEWRRWDLHVHTSSSYDYLYKAADSEKKLIEGLKNEGISVVAITDHFVIDKKKIDKLRELTSDIVFFPGVELRTDKGSNNIHVILIFSEDINLDELSESFNVFKRENARNPEDNEKVYWDYQDITEFAKKHNALISIHAGSKKSGIDDKISNILPISQAIKEEYANTVSIFEMGNLKDLEAYKKNVFPTIGVRPMIICSDNHDARSYNPCEKLWIKADPTFKGLKQAILEPERIFIGNIPPSLDRICKNKTKIIEKINIQYEKDYQGVHGEWFNDIQIEFNPEMTAIIGNKGSGKTAIAEITALLCNAQNNKDDYLFLHENKFKKKNLASNFNGKITWKDEVLCNLKNLGEKVDPNAKELIHFVPQKSFEKFCNESEEDFISEIDNVVFSRLDEADKLGFSSFKELIENQKTVINAKKDSLFIQIKNLNLDIKKLEEQNDINFKNKLNASLEQIILEKKEHLKIKPSEVLAPDNLNTPEYQKYIKKKEQIDTLICKYNEKHIVLKKRQSDLTLIKKDIANLKSDIGSRLLSIKTKLAELGINDDSVFSYVFDETGIDTALTDCQLRINSIIFKIGNENNEGFLIKQKKAWEAKINECNNLNSGKLTAYQNYKKEFDLWQKRQDELSIREQKLKNDIEYIGDFQNSQLIQDIKTKRIHRLEKTKEIFNSLQEEVKIYDKLKEKIISFIDRYKSEIKNYNISIQSGVYIKSDFSKNFVEKYINNTVNGPFKGIEGLSEIKKIIDECSIDTWEGLSELLETIQRRFDTFDNGNKSFINMFKKDQYDACMNYLYNLNFLDTRYSLRLYDKPLNELSPGERGSLLLIFYLLLDARDIPLIIDQPEDNLDNESVANILVPFIREAKKRRQIIIITHNSNLAVVSDAEQIIRVKIDKQNNNKFSFKSGSLESYMINDVVNVLEGTKNSFDIRNNKYDLGG